MRTFALVLLLLCVDVAGCVATRHKPPVLAENPGQPVPVAAMTPQQREIYYTGQLAAAKAEVAELRLAPLRTTLNWAEGIAALGLLASVGLAAAAGFWGLGFTWKIPAGFAVAFGAVLATALFASWALNYLWLLVVAVLALAVLGVLWLVHRHMSLASATKMLWDATPPEVLLPNKIEAFLDHVAK